ncbi:coiled-coil domain-containing protein 6-like [Penaeus vannamei]|uniref:coiled-coil domain-containing protein 6-like n=1 Tax=Penaeus vannamei TaxID=6689 RepID=UPI00387FB136
MDKLEAEKRMLQGKLEQPISNPPSPADFNQGDRANNLSSHIQHLRNEVTRFREQLTSAQEEHNRTTQQYANEERLIREENLRLQRKLQMEIERREALCSPFLNQKPPGNGGNGTEVASPQTAPYPLWAPCPQTPLRVLQATLPRYHCKIFLQELVVLYLLVEIALTQSLTPVCVSLDDPGVAHVVFRFKLLITLRRVLECIMVMMSFFNTAKDLPYLRIHRVIFINPITRVYFEAENKRFWAATKSAYVACPDSARCCIRI